MTKVLAGVRIVDLTQVAAGPYATSMLGDFGADVIKVEPPGGEPLRVIDDAYGEGESGYFFGLNRSKRAVAVDLKHSAGYEAFLRLVDTADIVIVSMRPQAVRQLAIDYETLRARKPELIYASITAFGESGPRAADPGMDLLTQALGGLMGTTGEVGGPPMKVGPPVSDFATSYLICFGILAALRVRDQTGEGQQVCVSLLDATVGMLANYVTPYLRTKIPIRPVGAGHPQIVPYQAFLCEDGWVVVACLVPRFWRNLCRALGRDELIDDPRFVSNTQRVAHRAELVALLTDVFRTGPRARWEALLRDHDVPVAAINKLEDVITDSQVVHNEMITSVRHPRFGEVPVVANPVKLSATPPAPHGYPPAVGEHTDEVLLSIGLTVAEVAALRATGVVE